MIRKVLVRCIANCCTHNFKIHIFARCNSCYSDSASAPSKKGSSKPVAILQRKRSKVYIQHMCKAYIEPQHSSPYTKSSLHPTYKAVTWKQDKSCSKLHDVTLSRQTRSPSSSLSCSSVCPLEAARLSCRRSRSAACSSSVKGTIPAHKHASVLAICLQGDQ